MDQDPKSAQSASDEGSARTFVEVFMASPAATLRDMGLLSDPQLTQELESAMYGADTFDCVRAMTELQDLAVKVTAGGTDSR